MIEMFVSDIFSAISNLIKIFRFMLDLYIFNKLKFLLYAEVLLNQKLSMTLFKSN